MNGIRTLNQYNINVQIISKINDQKTLLFGAIVCRSIRQTISIKHFMKYLFLQIVARYLITQEYYWNSCCNWINTHFLVQLKQKCDEGLWILILEFGFWFWFWILMLKFGFWFWSLDFDFGTWIRELLP